MNAKMMQEIYTFKFQVMEMRFMKDGIHFGCQSKTRNDRELLKM